MDQEPQVITEICEAILEGHRRILVVGASMQFLTARTKPQILDALQKRNLDCRQSPMPNQIIIGSDQLITLRLSKVETIKGFKGPVFQV